MQDEFKRSRLFGTLYRWFVIGSFTFITAVLVMPLAILRMSEAIHKVAIFWGKTIFLMSGSKLQVHGAERAVQEGPVIVLSNHQSMFDIGIMYKVLPVSFRWMAKSSLFRIPFFGWAMKGAGYIPVERDDRKKALKSLFDAAVQIRGGKSVIVFPEGTRGKADGALLSFKKGGFILAKKAGVVLQPMTIWGAHRIMPPQRDRKIQRVSKGLIHVEMHEPIRPDEYENMTPEELSTHVRNIMQTSINRFHDLDRAGQTGLE